MTFYKADVAYQTNHLDTIEVEAENRRYATDQAIDHIEKTYPEADDIEVVKIEELVSGVYGMVVE